MSPGLQTAVAEIVVPLDRPAAFAAAGRLVDLLWGGRTEVVTAEPPSLLVHTVAATPGSDDVDAWLTWEFSSPSGGRSTRIRLVCDEADTSDGPPPELDEVLSLLADLLQTSPLDERASS